MKTETNDHNSDLDNTKRKSQYNSDHVDNTETKYYQTSDHLDNTENTTIIQTT